MFRTWKCLYHVADLHLTLYLSELTKACHKSSQDSTDLYFCTVGDLVPVYMYAHTYRFSITISISPSNPPPHMATP